MRFGPRQVTLTFWSRPLERHLHKNATLAELLLSTSTTPTPNEPTGIGCHDDSPPPCLLARTVRVPVARHSQRFGMCDGHHKSCSVIYVTRV